MTTPVVLVTGALTGIGRATALAFAREGARVVISGRHDDEGQKLVAELQKLGAEAEFLRSDVRHEDDVRSLIDQDRLALWPSGCCRQLRRNRRHTRPGDGTDCRNLRRDLRYQRPRHAAQHEARNARDACPGQRQHRQHIFHLRPHRCCRRFSILGEQACGRRTDEVGRTGSGPSGVRVNMVAPGPIDTGMLNRFTGTDERKTGLVAKVPLKRVGRPEEIAQTIVFLASDKASFITGASYLVDGGKTAQ